MPDTVFFALLLLAAPTPESILQQLKSAGAAAITLEHAQLDADPEPEAIIRYTQGDTGAHALILDWQSKAWREVAHFNTWWNFTPADAASLLTLKPTVDPAINDLIVRTRSGGTEVARTTFEIHRLRNGAATNVFSLTEHETAMEHPSGDVYTTNASIQIAPPRITVHSTRNPGSRRATIVFTWNPEKFRFDATAPPPPSPTR